MGGRGRCVIPSFLHPIAKRYMKQSLQLKIPTPCGEDWARMQPTEKGRHCQSCCKTVVDFTEMSDAEIIRYLSQAGPHVCGRVMPDQLNRTLAPAPVQKNGRSGWAWVLASLLMLAEGSDKGRPVKTGKIEVRDPKAEPDTTALVEPDTKLMIMGEMSGPGHRVDSAKLVPPRVEGASGVVRGRRATKLVPDTNRVEMGKVAMAEADSIRLPADTLPAAVPPTMPLKSLTGIAGGIQVCVKVTRITDILTDTVKQIAADTLAALGWRPAPDLNIYPNPVSRGGSIQLAWKTEPGQYQLTLMSTRGQLIAERMLDVGGVGQVDSWEIPASLAAGIYILRVVRLGNPGGSGAADAAGTGAASPVVVCTREVMVR